MRVVTAAEMGNIDKLAVEKYGIPSIVLMENAGIKVVEAVCRQLGGNVRGKAVTIFVGKGNNGGDGLVAARHLLNMGADVRVLMVADPAELKGDALTNLTIWQNLGQRVYPVHQPNGINLVKVSLLSTDLIIDAIFGTGFKGTVGEKFARIIELINNSGLPVVAVDIPSGLGADTGIAHGSVVKATTTVTFGLPKLGLVMEGGAAVSGDLHVVDIGLPRQLLSDQGIKRHLLDDDLIKKWLPKRKPTGHKGDFGRVLVVAGSRGMVGAALLTATAVLKSGAGLVTLALPESLYSAVMGLVPEIMMLPLPEQQGAIAAEAGEIILEKLKQMDVLAIGPGLSQQPATVSMVQRLLPQVTIPTVVDADALNSLAKAEQIIEQINAPLVLTPHGGEMSRLVGKPVAEVMANRLSLVQQQAKAWGCTILLKGARTLVAEADGTLYINPTGNNGMATAGSGDVLTGLIAGLIAQGLDVGKAAAAGAYLHGKAGDLGSAQVGCRSLLAGDILQYLPQCFN